VAAAICYPALAMLPRIWRSIEFYGHGYAIPAVAAYLVYVRRTEISSAWRDLRPPVWGVPVAFGIAALQVVMIVGDVGFGAGLGIPLVLGSTLYAIGGLLLVRPFLLPLTFLALMVPPPRFLTYELLFRLKLFVTDVSVRLLQGAGQSIAAEGNQILVPGHTLYVADACTGLTSIITLLPLSCIVAYFLSHGIWRRLVVVGSVVPLAIAANLIRIIVTVQLVSTYGVEYAQGLLHESFGLTTYVLGTLALLGVAKVLR
jgi:exosortase